MTNPVPSSNWASKIDAATREYIDARIHEELKPMRDDIEALHSAILQVRESLQRDFGDVAGRVTNAEDLIGMSSSRLAQLAKMANCPNCGLDCTCGDKS